jgi:hypothetical protein
VVTVCNFTSSFRLHPLLTSSLVSSLLPHAIPIAARQVRCVNFDSKLHSLAQLIETIRGAHRAFGKPFASLAFANHGQEESGKWTICNDLVVDISPVSGLPTPVIGRCANTGCEPCYPERRQCGAVCVRWHIFLAVLHCMYA